MQDLVVEVDILVHDSSLNCLIEIYKQIYIIIKILLVGGNCG